MNAPRPPFAGQPKILATPNLTLEPPSDAFAADVFDYGSEAEFAASLARAPFTDISEARDYVDYLRRENESGRRQYWFIKKRAGPRVVGSLGFLFRAEAGPGLAEFGYGVSHREWGSGLFQEAARAVLAYGFRELGLARVQAITVFDNHRAIRGIEKLGFVLEGRLRQYYHWDGRRRDAAILSLLPGDLTGEPGRAQP